MSSRKCGKFVFPGILHSNWKHINTPNAISFYPSNCSLHGNKATRELLQWTNIIDPEDHWSHEVFKVWSFGKIINHDKNIMQRMKPTALFNLTFLYHWFSWNATNDSQVLHILEDKSRFTCITGFTDHIPILGTFHASCAKFGPDHVSCILKPFATLFSVAEAVKMYAKLVHATKRKTLTTEWLPCLFPGQGGENREF